MYLSEWILYKTSVSEIFFFSSWTMTFNYYILQRQHRTHLNNSGFCKRTSIHEWLIVYDNTRVICQLALLLWNAWFYCRFISNMSSAKEWTLFEMYVSIICVYMLVWYVHVFYIKHMGKVRVLRIFAIVIILSVQRETDY